MNFKVLIESLAKEDDKGNLYIIKSDLENLKLNDSDSKRLDEILKAFNIAVKDFKTEKDRSPLVRDYDYGIEESYDKNYLDLPRFAKLSFNDAGELIGEDYSKLDEFLDEFITSNVVLKQKRDKITKEITMFPSIQLNSITKLKLSELEEKHVMEYLKEQGIRVCGYSESLDDFENYDYYRTYKTAVLPKPLDEKELQEKFNLFYKTKDPILRQELILHNMRLVPYFAWRYAAFYGIDIHELESYGYEGLMIAVDRYDPNRFSKFISFAKAYIKGYLSNGVQEIFTNKKNNFSNAYIQIKKIVESENATTLDESPELLEDIIELLTTRTETGRIDEKIIRNRVNLLNQEQIDLFEDNLIGEEDFTRNVDLNILKEQINSVLSTLTPKEEAVLKLRFGLDGGEPCSLIEVGKLYGVGKERIRQIEAKALRKLRHPSRIGKIRNHYEDFFDDYNLGPRL